MAQAARIIRRYTVQHRPFTDKGAPAKRQWVVCSPYGAVWRFATEEKARQVAAAMQVNRP